MTPADHTTLRIAAEPNQQRREALARAAGMTSTSHAQRMFHLLADPEAWTTDPQTCARWERITKR